MNCATHDSVAAVAYCRTCGKPLCAACARDVRGTIFCEHCLAERVAGALPPAPVPGSVGAVGTAPVYTGARLPSPGMAAVLGFIPGVGAMYNGQFMKGFIHVMAFVSMIWMADRFGPIMIPVFFAYFFYLVFDAYKTAHALELGQPVPDPFGFEKMFPSGPHAALSPVATGTATNAPDVTIPTDIVDLRPRKNVPTGAVVLIGLGVLFMLRTVGIFDYDIGRFWSLILVFLGGWMLARRWGLVGSTGGACECEQCRMRGIMWPVIFIAAGILILMDEFGISIWRTWPAILLVIGAVKLLQSNASDAGHLGGPPVIPTPDTGVAPPPPPPEPPVNQEQASSEVNHG
jgi:TM2 domain-containing membrane protein YozV